MIIRTNEQGEFLCMWRPYCARLATGYVQHPVLDAVPTCQPCADAADQILKPARFELIDDTEKADSK